MTPPRGAESGSLPTTRSDTATELSVPAIAAAPVETVSTASPYQQWRLALDASYLLHGEGGQPFRVGLMGRFRPLRELAFGLRLESNFSDEILGALRIDGIVPITSEFSLYAAFEAGVRGLIGQNHVIDEINRSLNGALFQFALEAGVDIQVHPNVSLGAFARIGFAPGGAISMDALEGNPPAGASYSGHELTAGIRIGWDFAPASVPLPEPESDTAPEIVAATSAITGIESIVTEIEAEPARTVTSSTDAPSPEDLEALRSELRTLRSSAENLQTQIAAADRVFRSLQRGQEIGSEFRMRLDRIYDGLDHHPPQIDVPAIETYLGELETGLRDNRDLRLLIQSSTEAFGNSFLGNVRIVRDTLLTLQSRLPLVASGPGAISRAALDPLIPRINAVIAVVEDLRRRTVSTEPSTDQIELWRAALANLEHQIADLSPRLETTQREQLNTEFTRLNENFTNLVGALEENERLWLIARANFGHYQAFQDARRPDQAVAALTAMLTTLRGAPESFRSVHRRGLENLRIAMSGFIERHPNGTRWRAARELAVQVAQWIDPSFVPPVTTSTRRRVGSTGSTGGATPRERPTTGGTATERPRTGGSSSDHPRFRVPDDDGEGAE